MKEELVTKERSIVVPFLVGGIVGAALGLLFAPKAGREVRKQIKDIAVNGKEKLVSAAGKTREFYTEALTAVNSAIDAGKQAYLHERDKVEMAH
ncbi:MAG TPA: YtxH domain-containing protein [Nitrospirota bacterium]|nr:YtxH domain-containing protein [Nitrospirota bacterium]